MVREDSPISDPATRWLESAAAACVEHVTGVVDMSGVERRRPY